MHQHKKDDCEKCKLIEKQYFQSESKYLKAVDKIKILKQLLETNQESGSLLPQSEQDFQTVKQIAAREPARVVQRLDLLMTELNFLTDVLDMHKIDPRLK